MQNIGARPETSWKVAKESVDMTRPAPAPKRVEIEAQPQNVAFDLAKSAFVIVDMQNDFCETGGLMDHLGIDFAPARNPIGPINALLPTLRANGVPIVWLNWGNRPDRRNLPPSVLHAFNPDGEGIGIGGVLPANGHKALEKDSWAAALVEELDNEPDDIYVDKFRLSGFWDTPLDSILRQHGVTTVLFGGVNVDQCVLCTLQDASFLGYDTILLEDCSATTSPPFCWDATLFNVRLLFGFTATGAALIEAAGRS